MKMKSMMIFQKYIAGIVRSIDPKSAITFLKRLKIWLINFVMILS